jgi:hypothetical protein
MSALSLSWSPVRKAKISIARRVYTVVRKDGVFEHVVGSEDRMRDAMIDAHFDSRRTGCPLDDYVVRHSGGEVRCF